MDRVLTAGVLLCVPFLSVMVYAQKPLPRCPNTTYVGILDDAREEMLNWKPGVAHRRLIRPAFEKSCSGWQGITSASALPDMTWTVALDGKDIGKVKSQTETTGDEPGRSVSRYLTLVQTIVTPVDAIPSVGAPSEKYAPLADGPTKGRRPLVVVSAPNFSDPDGWRHIFQPPNQIAALVRETFRRDFLHAVRCKEEKVVERNWKFPDSLLSLPVVYASNKKSFLIEASLDAGDCGFIDDPDDPLSNPWFFVSSDGRVRRIGSFMSLLDAGDYDNDGRSELIFMVNQPEDTEGFVLFDAALHKQGSMLWTYH